jgi:RNA polymerase-interacting CarD/CdnL/TRCF family regulator
MAYPRSWTDEQLVEAVKTSRTFTEVYNKLGFGSQSSNHTVRKYVALLKLDTSHFMSPSEQRLLAGAAMSRLTHDEMFAVNNVDRQHIKRTIIEQHLLPYECVV